MKVYTAKIHCSSKGNTDIVDLTPQLLKEVKTSLILTGLASIFTPSSTSGITTIEYESGCLDDLKLMFDRIAPEHQIYKHNARWGDGNGHSHIRAALLGPSVSIPVIDGKLFLGTWQQVILVDFDNRPRQRALAVQILGE